MKNGFWCHQLLCTNSNKRRKKIMRINSSTIRSKVDNMDFVLCEQCEFSILNEPWFLSDTIDVAVKLSLSLSLLLPVLESRLKITYFMIIYLVKIVQNQHLISCHNWYRFMGTLGQALDKCQCHPHSIVFCTRIDFLIWLMIRVLVQKLDHSMWRKSIVIYVGLIINPCVYGLEMMKFISVRICCGIYVLMERKERKKKQRK